ncbi:hypothetical protein EON80_22540, partial [bacterium]
MPRLFSPITLPSLAPCLRLSVLLPIGLLITPPAVAQPVGQPQTIIPAPPANPITFEELPALIGEPTDVTFSGTGVAVAEVKAAMLEAAGIDATATSGLMGTRDRG